ncbi:TPA: hydrogenase, partial [Enterobacter kobei]|nr:hydrogenase [Enterobacter kobei]
DQKLKGQNHTEVDNEQASLLLPSIPLDTRVMIEREARRLAGYYQGRQISDHFLTLLDGATVQEVSGRVDEWLRQANDPRLAEIVKRLVHSLNQGGVHV